MASMVAKVINNSCSSHLSSLSIQEKGSRNKRKFRTDVPSISDPNKVITSGLNDGSTYEFSAEKFEINTGHEHPQGPCDMCGMCEDPLDALKLDLGLSTAGMGGSSEVGPTRAIEEIEGDEFQDADWSDLTESQLEELLLSNLDAIFISAIKKIIVSGYSVEVASKAVLRSGLCYGSKDIISNIVDNALVILRNGQNIDSSRDHCFQDLQQLAKYVLAELICVIREVKPFFSTGDAMWCLLISDMNVSHALSMDSDPMSSLIRDSGSHDSSSNIPPRSEPTPEPKNTEMSLPSPCKPVSAVPCRPVTRLDIESIAGAPKLSKPKKSNAISGPTALKEGSTSSGPLTPLEKPFNARVSQISAVEDKFVSGKKINSTQCKKEYTLRQKLERSYRATGTKGSFRTTKVSGYILDKRGKPMTESSSLCLKNASLKISKAMAMGLELAHESGSLSFSTSSSFTMESRTTISQSIRTSHSKTKPVVSPADTELSLSLPTKDDTRQVNLCVNGEVPNRINAKLPFDKSMTQWVSLDEKDEMIMKLLPRIRDLQNQLEEWTEWANQKVMQAAQRLGKDRAELKTLRQEKEEVERLKKDKYTLQENTVKKLSEMEKALGQASKQIERANAAVRRLEVENAGLRQEMETAKLRATESAASCHEVSNREKETLVKFQSWEREKAVFQEELAVERRKMSQIQQELEHAKDLHSQLVARWKQEEKTKDELLTQANSIRKERGQLEASAKSKEDSIRLNAETKLLKYKADILKLENEISQLRLKTDSSKIAALKKGIDGSHTNRLPNSRTAPPLKENRDSYQSSNRVQDFSGVGGVKRERECVMCLSEEMSVVFLPCAHQVVCKMCNELHEKQGMTDCPSCRGSIIRRISVRYARS